MWQDSGFGLGPKRKGPSQKAKSNPKHLRRTTAQIKFAGQLGSKTKPEVIMARLILNDFTPKGICLFCTKAVAPGREVSITIDEPKQFFAKGRIVSSQEVASSSRVITKKKFSHRVKVEFVFDSDEQAKQVEEYCNDLFKEYLGGSIPKAA